ncbi:MAG: hypothetical protein ACYDD0_07830 [Candidatus Dormibacteria bacterium]
MSQIPDPPPAGDAIPDPHRAALLAAIEAFAGSRSGRRLLDNPGRLGADAVSRARPIPGARRASHRAQTALEDAAARMERARDRWGALMQGLADDRDVSQQDLVSMVNQSAARVAIQDARAATGAALAAARAAGGPYLGCVKALEDALAALNRIS